MTTSLRRAAPRRGVERAVEAFLLVTMAVGCVVLWIGLPVGVLYLTSRMADTSAGQFLLALPMTLIAMIAFARVLFWVNRLYLRVDARVIAAGDDWEDDEDSEDARFARGPLEPMLIVSLLIAIVALFVWFFAFAQNPSHQVI